MKKQVWGREAPGSWLDFQEYLGTLWIEPRVAGVPRRLVARLESAAESFWQSTEDSGDPEVGWFLRDESVAAEFDQARGDVYDWLDAGWRP